MTKDYGWHRKTRREIIETVKDYDEIYFSHENEDDIKFFRRIDNNDIHLAEPDVLLKKDNHVLIIEIELSNSPKHLMGVAFAVHASNKCKYQGQHIDIKQKSLLLVLCSENVFKKGSGKPKQIQEIKSLIKNLLPFEYLNIVTEKKAVNLIQSWITGKVTKGDICD